MRTIDEIKAQLTPENRDFESWQGRAEAEGRNVGLRTAIFMIEDGESEEDFIETAKDVYKRHYQDYPDDERSYWGAGYAMAMLWCAEQFDYDAEGWPIYRAGNFLNHPAGVRPTLHP